MTARSLCLSLALLASPSFAEMPQLKTNNGVTQLFVDGKPYLAIGGELGNSTAADADYLDAVLARCHDMHLNTVMLPVYWDRIETEEGKYNFDLLHAAIEQARKHDLHLVLLWFGTWKNSMSCYAPGWMKRDTQRFPRVKSSSRESLEIISPSCEAAADADAKVFAELMRFVKRVDASRQTVIMVQVENEMAMLGEPRDHSEKSEAAYAAAVPQPVLDALAAIKLGPELTTAWKNAGGKLHGSWAEVFGGDNAGQEAFTAWQLATYTEKVAAAGKKEYGLPMYVNAALIRPGRKPIGGPLPHLLELWRVAAPSIDMLSPDIYFPSFAEWAERYVRSGNPLFIPEMAPSTRMAGNALYAVAQLKAIGYGPFAIEDLASPKRELISQLNQTLAGMSSIILDAQAHNQIVGISLPTTFDWQFYTKPQTAALGDYAFTAQIDLPTGTAATTQTTELPTLGSGRWDAPAGTPDGAVMIIHLDGDDYVLVGRGVTITFAPADGKGHIGLDQVQEGSYHDGHWIGGRWLNGDQTHQGRHVRFEASSWGVQRVRLYRYE